MLYIDIPIAKKIKIMNLHKNYCNIYIKPKLEQFKSDIEELEKRVPKLIIKSKIDILKLFVDDLYKNFNMLVVGEYESLVNFVIYDDKNSQKASIIEKFENAKKAYSLVYIFLSNLGTYKNNLKDHLLQLFDYNTFSDNKIFIVSKGYHQINRYLKNNLEDVLGSLRSKRDKKSKKNKILLYINILHELLKLNDSAIKKNRDLIYEKINELKIKEEIRIDKVLSWLKELRDKIEKDEEFQWSVYKLVRIIGLNVCPYCDRQFITILETNKKYRPQLDHFIPKSRLPFFAISLFNLIPSCGICNSSIKTSVNFIPLTKEEFLLFDSNEIDVKYTTISPYSKIMKKYIKEKLFKFDILPEKKYIKVHRLRVNYFDNLEKNVIRLLKNFCIIDIYNQSHKDELEDIYIRRNLMNSNYTSNMCDYIQKKFGLSEEYSNSIINRVILGNNYNLYNKKPLDKLTYDLLMEE